MAPPERHAAAVEIVGASLSSSCRLVVVGDRVVGILLMSRIRLLRRRVDADADHFLVRVAHADDSRSRRRSASENEPKPARRCAAGRATVRIAAPAAAADAGTGRCARARSPGRARSADAAAERRRARRTTGCCALQVVDRSRRPRAVQAHPLELLGRDAEAPAAAATVQWKPVRSCGWLTAKRRTSTPRRGRRLPAYSFFHVR